MTGEKFLEVKNLRTYFDTPEGMVKSVDGVSFSINRGEHWLWWENRAAAKR